MTMNQLKPGSELGLASLGNNYFSLQRAETPIFVIEYGGQRYPYQSCLLELLGIWMTRFKPFCTDKYVGNENPI